MGSCKHPAFSFWHLKLCFILFGQSVTTFYFASQCWTVLGLWSLWRLSRHFVSERMSLLVVLATATYRYYNMGVLNFTPSSPTTALTCLGIYLFFLALKYNKIYYWIFIGIALAAGMQCKYSSAIDAFTMLAFMVCVKQARRYWKCPGPYLTIGTTILLCLPYLYFLYQHDFEPVGYMENVVASQQNFAVNFQSAAKFFASQIALFLPIGIALIPLTGWLWEVRIIRKNDDAIDNPHKVPAVAILSQVQETKEERPQKESKFERCFLSFMIFFPLAIYLGILLIGGGHFRTAYGAPLWPLYGLWLVTALHAKPGIRPVRQSAILSLLILLTCLASYAGCYMYSFNFSKKMSSINYPAQAIGRVTTRLWNNYSLPPDACLSGNWRLVAPAYFFMDQTPVPLVYYCDQNELSNPRTKPVAYCAGDDDLNVNGGLILWTVPDDGPRDFVPDWLLKRYPAAHIGDENFSIPYRTRQQKDTPSILMRYAVVFPVTVTRDGPGEE
ncbi:MAG: glycosyltransferase family 39 protein [Planctomycetia bacterium]|nr:glycosyltransferase family 39 protein [Planctomycetia bacterium]